MCFPRSCLRSKSWRRLKQSRRKMPLLLLLPSPLVLPLLLLGSIGVNGIHCWVLSVVTLYKRPTILEVVNWFPGVLRGIVSFPFDKVIGFVPDHLCVQNLFDLILVFIGFDIGVCLKFCISWCWFQ